MNVVSVQEAELHLQLQSGDGGAFLANVIKLVSTKLARYCGRDDWGPAQSRTEYHDGGSQYILPRYWPITSFQLFDDVDHVWAADTELDDDDFYATETGLIVAEGWRLSPGVRNIKLVYTAGYANTAAIPEQVRYAALVQLEREYNARKRVGKTVELGSGSAADLEILPEVAALLSPHVRRAGFATC